ncbi:MAG: HAD family phosphatase [Lachnospiraceae bacterium]|nr:HAD family phosphatase [Lachnospiraceae bacterium]
MEKVVIFDMDGVIFDTENQILNIWCYLAGKYGIEGIENVFYRSIGTDREETRKIVLDSYGPDFPYDKFRQESSRLFRERADREGIPVKAGVRELLPFLKINGYRMGLASSTRYVVVREELEGAGLFDFFETVIGGDMVERSKPAPDIYLKACEEMGVKPESAYAIEDSKNGVRSAASAGLKVFLIPDLIEPDEEMRELAYEVYPDLIELRRQFFASITASI